MTNIEKLIDFYDDLAINNFAKTVFIRIRMRFSISLQKFMLESRVGQNKSLMAELNYLAKVSLFLLTIGVVSKLILIIYQK
jgi:hypothetical protein